MLDGLSTELVGAAIYDLGKELFDRVSTTEWVQATLKKWDLTGAQHDFAARYLEALVVFRLQDKPAATLHLFRSEDIRRTFFDFYYGAPEKRGNEAVQMQALAQCLEALKVGDDTKAAGIDVDEEVSYFWTVFRQKVQESRTVKEVEIDQKLQQLQRSMDDVQQILSGFKSWLQEEGKTGIQVAGTIYNIDKIDNALFNGLITKLQHPSLQQPVKAARHKPVPNIYPRPHIGREAAVQHLHSFFESSNGHFLFLFGTGGMGKSHLLQEVASHLTTKPAYFRLGQATNMISLANEMGYGDVAALTPAQQRDLFLSKAAAETEPLVFDDFYELRDEVVYKTILELSNQSQGKFLIISRALPLDYEGIYIGEERQLEVNELTREDFSVHLENYHTGATFDFELTPELLHACWEHCKGYPLGGEFLLKLRAVSGEDFGDDIATISKIDPTNNKRHHDFIKRLLDSILKKGTPEERELARQMAVFTEPMPREVLAGLPGFDRDTFFALTERKKIFYSLKGDFFGAHALVRTVLEIENGVSYEAHTYAGHHYEQAAQADVEPDIDRLTIAIYHFEKGQIDNDQTAYLGFLSRWKPKFNLVSVKALVTPDIKKTIEQLRFRLRLQVDDLSAMNELGRALRRDRQIEEAIEVLKKAAEAGNVYSMNELGITYREAKRLLEAIEVLNKAANSGNEPSMNELGITYREAKRLPEAIEVLKKAAEAGNIRSMNELGITYREAKRLPEAIDVLKKAVDLQPNNVILFNELGITYREAKRLPEAIEVLKKAVDAGSIQSMNELGITYREAKRLPEAIEVLKKSADAGNIVSMNELGITYREAKRMLEAIEVLKKSADAGNMQSMNELGITYREAKRMPEAIEVLKKSADAGNIQSMNELGITYREAKRLPEAIEVLKKAVDAGSIQSMNELGITYRQEKHLLESIEVLKKATETGDVISMNELGMSYREAKRLPEAIEILKRAVEAGNIQSFNELGITYRDARLLPEAIEILKRAVGAENIQSFNELGITYREAKRLPEAIEILNKALEINPKNTFPKYTLLQIYLLHQPDPDKAKRFFSEMPPHYPAGQLRKSYEQVVENFEAILNFENSDIRLYRTYIWLLFRYESWDWAVVFLEKLTKTHYNMEFQANLGKALSHTGRAKEALPLLVSAMAVTSQPGMEKHYRQNVADYLDALKLAGSNKEVRKKFELYKDILSSLPDFEARKAYWLDEQE